MNDEMKTCILTGGLVAVACILAFCSSGCAGTTVTIRGDKDGSIQVSGSGSITIESQK